MHSSDKIFYKNWLDKASVLYSEVSFIRGSTLVTEWKSSLPHTCTCGKSGRVLHNRRIDCAKYIHADSLTYNCQWGKMWCGNDTNVSSTLQADQYHNSLSLVIGWGVANSIPRSDCSSINADVYSNS